MSRRQCIFCKYNLYSNINMNKNYAFVPYAVDCQFLLHFLFISCEPFLLFVTLPLRSYLNQKRGKMKVRMGCRMFCCWQQRLNSCFVSQFMLCQGGESNLLSCVSWYVAQHLLHIFLSSGTVLLPPQLGVSVPCVLNRKTSSLLDLESRKLLSKC